MPVVRKTDTRKPDSIREAPVASYDDALDLIDPPRHGFAVTIREEVGWVDFNGRGDHNPAEAALLIIARVGRDGLYEFPGPDENTTTRVEVNWTVPDGA